MSLQFYIKGTNEAVIVEDKPFASGGEGGLHIIESPTRFVRHVAKIFHLNKRDDQQREAKINYLIANRPKFEFTPGHDTIIWVEHSLYDEKGNFVGFVMPLASGEKLEVLCAPKLPKYLSGEWNRLEFGHEDSLRLRLKVCYNIAAAIHQIHSTGKYVLVDLKPDNVLIHSTGLISIVDTDSFEIIENGKTTFPATVVTPEYTPPEYYEGTRPGHVTIENSWDRFSLAVIFYRILFGIHPFAASAIPPYDNLVSLGDKIHHGLYVHHHKKNNVFSVIPPPHRKFEELEDELKELFQTTFIDGHENPDARITAEQWAMAFLNSTHLVIDRPLPSKTLNLDKTLKQNWYEAAVNKVIDDMKLSAPVPQVIATKIVQKDTFANQALNDYKQAGSVLLNLAKFGGLVFGIVSAFVVIIALFGGTFSMGTALEVLSELLMAVPLALFWLLRNPVLLLAILVPFFLTIGKKSWTMITQGIGQAVEKLQESFAFSLAQRRRRLEDKQYALFSKRVKIKQKLQEIKTELNILDQVKNKKEENYQKQYGQKVKDTNQEIQSDINKETYNIQLYDQKARELMREEAKEIKALRVEFMKTLKNISPYKDIVGNNPEQKIANLEAWKKRQIGSPETIEQEAKQIEQQLLKLRSDLDNNIAEIKTRFNALHDDLLNNGKQHKIKIDDIINSATEKIRIEGKLDSQLIDKSYKKLLKTRNELLVELFAEEQKMNELNDDIKTVRDNLNTLK